MKWIASYIFILAIVGCNNKENLNYGTYQGFYYETLHKLKLNSNKSFTSQTEGHLGAEPVNGTYLIKNDTIILKSDEAIDFGRYYVTASNDCIINLEMHRDLCIDTDNLNPDILIVNYPQTKPKSEDQVELLRTMLNGVLSHPDLREYLSTKENIYIKEYYEVNKEFSVDQIYADKSIQIISVEETEAINEYFEIDEVRIGIESAMIRIRSNSEYGGHLVFYEKVENRWKMQPRTLDEK